MRDQRSGRVRTVASVPPHRSAFTLLELLVALGLVTILLAALGAAIDFHYRVVQKARDQVEEAQLARALLERIAKDIRGAVPYDPVNFEKLIPGLVTQGGQSGLSALGEAAGLDSELFGELTGESGGTSLGGDWTTTTLPRTVPGLYGGADWIEVDASRLPRPDQLSSEIVLASEGMLVDRVSDVKTVAYFVVSPEETINYTFSQAPGVVGFEEQGGLVRRELDRAVTAWAAQAGELDVINQQLEPIAPEVAAIQFAYFDGTQWTDSWDSDAQGCLPKAVEVRLYLRAASSLSGLATGTPSGELETAGITSALGDTQSYRVYRTVVYLPAAHQTGMLGATSGAEASGGVSSEEMVPESETESQPEGEMTESPAGPGSGPGSSGGPGGGPGESGGGERGGRVGGDRGGGDGRGSSGGFGRPEVPGGPGRGPAGPPTSGGGFGSPPPSGGPGGPPPSGFGGPSRGGGSPPGNFGPPPADGGGGPRR